MTIILKQNRNNLIFIVLVLELLFHFVPIQAQLVCRSATLPEIANGYYSDRSGDAAAYGTKTVRCNMGFSLSGATVVTCLPGGIWSRPGSCLSTLQARRCAALPVVANGLISGGLSILGAVRNVTCNPGFTTMTPTITCQANGTWTEPVDCIQPNCPAVPLIENGYFVAYRLPPGATSIRTFGAILELRCNECYQKADPANTGLISCAGARRLWTKARNSCKRIECSDLDLPKIENAKIEVGSLTCNSTRIISCNPGYVHLAGDTITCLPYGNWSNPGTICAPIAPTTSTTSLKTTPKTTQPPGCFLGDLPFLINAQYVGMKRLSAFGTSMEVRCNDGFSMVGPSTVTCEKGEWSLPGTCKATTTTRVTTLSTFPTTVIPSTTAVRTTTVTTPGKDCQPFRMPVLNYGFYLGLTEFTPSGTTVTISCYQGYNLTGAKQVICQSNGEWTLPGLCLPINVATTTQLPVTVTEAQTTAEPFCSANSFPKIPNGYVEIDGSNTTTFESGTIRRVLCNDGYDFGGQKSYIVCTLDGKWSQPNNNCTPIMTPGFCSNLTLPDIENGHVEPGEFGFKIRYPEGAFRLVACNQGYLSRSDVDQRTSCTSEGIWSQPTIVCSPIVTTPECSNDTLPVIENGFIDPGEVGFKQKYRVGNTRAVVCNYGFQFSVGSSDSVVCNSNGTWSEPSNKCVSSPSATTLVPPGFCLNSTLPTIENGHVEPGEFGFKFRYPEGANRLVVCNEGFSSSLNDVATTKCMPDGTWSVPGIICTLPVDPNFCSNSSLPKIENGHVEPGEFGFKVRYPINAFRPVACNPGYEAASGTSSTTCFGNNLWTDPLLKCVGGTSSTMVPSNKECWFIDLPFLFNGYFEHGLAGDLAKIKCYPGFVVRGPSEVTCNKQIGKWSAPGTCLPEDTPATVCIATTYPPIANGTIERTKDFFTPGETAAVHCRDGFELTGGPSVITCKVDSAWTQPGQCVLETGCATLPNVMNGFIMNGSSSAGSTRVIQCQPGFSILQPKISCQPSGKWTDPDACVEIIEESCPEPPEVPNGYWSPNKVPQRGTFRSQGAVLELMCDGNCYVRTGTQTPFIRCGRTFTWTKTMVSCETFECTSDTFPKIEHGKILDGPSACGSTREIACDDGFMLTGFTSTIICTNDSTWSKPLSLCLPNVGKHAASCADEIPAINHGRVEEGGNVVGVRRKVICDYGYHLDGQPLFVLCRSDGTWSPAPQCTPAQCTNGPPAMPGVQFVFSNGEKPASYPVGTVATFQCQTGYTLAKPGKLTCSEGDTWSGTLGDCQRIKTCGDLPPIMGGSATNGDSKPGSKRDIVCLNGSTPVGPRSIVCKEDGTWSSPGFCVL